MPQWASDVIFLGLFGVAALYLIWAFLRLVNARIRRKRAEEQAQRRRVELTRWETGMLELLGGSVSDEQRLAQLRRLHDIIDRNVRELGGPAPSLRASLEHALVLRTSEPQTIRDRLGVDRLPSVDLITRLIEAVGREPGRTEGQAAGVLEPQGEPGQVESPPTPDTPLGPNTGQEEESDEYFKRRVGEASLLSAPAAVIAAVGSFGWGSLGGIALVAAAIVFVVVATWAFGLWGSRGKRRGARKSPN